MTDANTHSADESIAVKTDRLEEIITQLEDGEISLERARELHSEGESLLEELEADLDIGRGDIVERE